MQTSPGCIPAHSAQLLLCQSNFILFIFCNPSWRPGCGVFGLWCLCLILPDGVVLAGCGCDIIARPRLPRLALHIPSASLPASLTQSIQKLFFLFNFYIICFTNVQKPSRVIAVHPSRRAECRGVGERDGNSWNSEPVRKECGGKWVKLCLEQLNTSACCVSGHEPHLCCVESPLSGVCCHLF